MSATFPVHFVGLPEYTLPNVAGGYRYQGANPNNYVSFNGKLFRIIGIFNGQMKIIQNEFYSTGKAWDTTGGTYALSVPTSPYVSTENTVRE